MESIDFTLHGQRIRVTRQQVFAAVKDLTPEPISIWGVEIDGRKFPVKQVMRVLIDDPRAEWFNSLRARSWFDRLGFHTFNARHAGTPISSREDNLDVSTAKAATVVPPAHATTENTRLAVLSLAVQFVGQRSSSELADVLATADAFATWVAGKGHSANTSLVPD